ncbi:hypothetical protein ACFX11_014517 [Malus domestica]
MNAWLQPPKLVTRLSPIVLWKHFFLALNDIRKCIMHSLLTPDLLPLLQFVMADVHLLFFENADPLISSEVAAVPMVVLASHLYHATHQALIMGLIKDLTHTNLMVSSVMLHFRVHFPLVGFNVKSAVDMVTQQSTISTISTCPMKGVFQRQNFKPMLLVFHLHLPMLQLSRIGFSILVPMLI